MANIVVNGAEAILGRMGSFVAKELLKGKNSALLKYQVLLHFLRQLILMYQDLIKLIEVQILRQIL